MSRWAQQLPALMQTAWLALLDVGRVQRLLRRLAARQHAGEDRTLQQQLQQLLLLIDDDHPPTAAPRAALLPQLPQWTELTVAERLDLLLLLLYGTAPADDARRAALVPALQRLRSDLPYNPAAACSHLRAALLVPHQPLDLPQRAHLADCAACRSYAAAWQRSAPELEALLRAQPLPPRLLRAEADLVRRALPQPPSAVTGRRAWLPLLPVLLLLALITLPSFRTAPAAPVPAAPAPTELPQRSADELIAAALTSLYTVPAEGTARWYGRYDMLWYFDEQVQAPLAGELWLDRDQPGRHRLQLSHRDGGAPYELELGDGASRLYYAVDAAYLPAAYGVLAPTDPEPATLLAVNATADQQQRLFAARLSSGPWQLPYAYLNQALNAADLRLLGRQTRAGRRLQLLAYRGQSPLEPYSADADPVTVLLAIDLQDGRLIEVSELIGPAAGTQISRRTWRFVGDERFVGAERERAAFSIERAWTGLAEIPERAAHLPLAPELPLLSAGLRMEPAELLGAPLHQPWLPTELPADLQRAYLLRRPTGSGELLPHAAVYLGNGRRLTLVFHTVPATLPLGPEAVREIRISALRGNRLRADITLTPSPAASSLLNMTVETDGFSRAEFDQLLVGLQPLNGDLLRAQDALFAPQADRRARDLLLALLAADRTAAAAQRILQVELAPRVTAFPYAWQPAGTTAERFFQQTNVTADGTVVVRRFTADRQLLTIAVEGPTAAWRWSAEQQVLIQHQPLQDAAQLERLRRLPLQQAAFDLLTLPGGPLQSEVTADGGLLVQRAVLPSPVEDLQRRPELVPSVGPAGSGRADDPAAWTSLIELELDARGELRRLVYAAAPQPGMRIVQQEYRTSDQTPLPAPSAPTLLRDVLLSGEILLLDRQRDGTQPTQPDLSSLALSLRQSAVFRYFLLADAAIERAELRPDVGRATLGSLTYEALRRDIGLATLYRLPKEQGSLPLVLLQAPRELLAALLQSGAVTVRGQPDAVRAADGTESWLVQFSGDGEQTLTLLIEREGTLIALSGPRALLEARAAELAAAIE
jgi:hypothetical protein